MPCGLGLKNQLLLCWLVYTVHIAINIVLYYTLPVVWSVAVYTIFFVYTVFTDTSNDAIRVINILYTSELCGECYTLHNTYMFALYPTSPSTYIYKPICYISYWQKVEEVHTHYTIHMIHNTKVEYII